MNLKSLLLRAARIIANASAELVPRSSQFQVFTQAEWDAKWRRYVESVGREAAREADRPYVFTTWIERSGRRLGMEMGPAIVRPPVFVCRGIIPIPAPPPIGTRQQMDALCAALDIKLGEMVYTLDTLLERAETPPSGSAGGEAAN